MTDTEIRIAIAEKCGWHGIKASSEHDGMIGMLGPLRGYQEVPHYPHDLNAMHEAEKTLGRLKKAAYGQELGCIAARIKGNYDEFDTFKLAHATARQRAEAFLRTFGLWKGGK